MGSIPLKCCTKCNRRLPATREYFSVQRIKKDGSPQLLSSCKECKRQYSKEHYRNCPEYREMTRASSKTNSKAVHSAFRERNRDRLRKEKKLRPNYQAESIVYAVKYKMKKMDLAYSFSVEDWYFCLKYFNQRCAVCGRLRGRQHIIAADHWIAVSVPDSPGTIPSNIVPLCHGLHGCNNSKGNSDPFKWLVSKFGEDEATKIFDQIGYYLKYVARQ